MTIPRDRTLDATGGLFFSEGYEYIANRCRRFGTDIFSTRLMLRNALCMQGAEAAEQFYHPGRFTRRRALPLFVLTLIRTSAASSFWTGKTTSGARRCSCR